MGYERYPRGTNPQGDYYGRQDPQDYGRDYGSGRDYSYSSARDYRAAGDRGRDEDRQPYGQREYGHSGYGQREQYGQRQRSGGYGQSSYGQSGYDQPSDRGRYDYGNRYATGRDRPDAYGNRWDRDDNARGRFGQDQGRGYGRQPQGYDYDERGFFARAGDEVRSWFGDDEAERRREADLRYDERGYSERAGSDRDGDYHNWRSGQIAALDRDYDDYRRENRSKFENEFSSWRTTRQGQRDQLKKVDEHMEVVGSDAAHVGTVDKVRGDRILLTKSDSDAGDRHHSIPCGWIQTVDTKVTLSKSADEAKKHWKDEERNQAMFGDRERDRDDGRDAQGRMLNRSFSGTY